MSSKKRASIGDEVCASTAREEIMLLLFRELSAHQQREQITYLRALFDANRISLSHLMGGLLKTVSNEDVRAAFKDVPAPGQKSAVKRKPPKKPGRDLGDAMGDYLDD